MEPRKSRLTRYFGRLLLWWWRKRVPRCHCGWPLHYHSRKIRAMVERQIREHGPMVRVNVGDRVWLVPRHYIALHGLRADEVAWLGFAEVTDVAIREEGSGERSPIR